MKLNDFIKQDPTPKKSGYKVVVGNTPKEQQLEKQASKVVVLETKNSQLNIEVDKLEQENKFLKEQVKINQHEKDEFKSKLDNTDNLKVELVQTENKLTDVLEEIHELTIKEQKNKQLIDDLRVNLNNSQGEADTLKKQQEATLNTLNAESAKLNGLSADYNRQKDFSEKLQNDYNKIRDRNVGLMNEREQLSRLKSEFEAKSIRLGDELIKAQEKIRNLEGKLVEITNLNDVREDEAIKSNNLSIKLRKDLDAAVKVSDSLESKLHESREDMEDLSQITQLYKDQLSREKRETAEWNIAKQQLKLGNAKTVPNKLGFGASPFFKLAEEK
jgi:chromosome segregation ATPase